MIPIYRMPPADSHPPLSDREIEVLRDWIDRAASYRHIGRFVPPKMWPFPRSPMRVGAAATIDRFVLRRLEQAGLTPSPAADRANLIRRVYLDLTGVTPTRPKRSIGFCKTMTRKPTDRLVDRLLASPEYAERFARPWLDLARYSDTNGYEKDRPRTIWPYRDWVIQAIAADMPFDQFSIEQLAGDMLPDATTANASPPVFIATRC